ncbi:MAG: type II toxin-antitoxin system RelE/ParE family toxin [Nitrospirae bacterium]|nr:type II toxin-antitoxin system RelE/ParE family toxin [Nitrospirota bacterium]
MAWTLDFKRDTLKFLSKQDQDTQQQIRVALNTLLDSLDKNIVPITGLDMRRLKGKWSGFIRLRLGKIRVIMKIDTASKIVQVHSIDYRGQVYK